MKGSRGQGIELVIEDHQIVSLKITAKDGVLRRLVRKDIEVIEVEMIGNEQKAGMT